jgi:hypothetical protein
MAATTLTTLTEITNSQWIERVILDYARNFTPTIDFVRWVDLTKASGRASNQAAFPRWVLDAVASATEATQLTTTELETTETTVDCSEVGIYRRVSDQSVESGILGDSLYDFLVRDSAELVALDVENTIVALFTGVTNSVGTSGSDLTIANMVEAQATVRKALMRGQLVYVQSDPSGSDVRSDNPVNCRDTLTVDEELRAICSQANWGQLEGSTTSARSLEQAVKHHERGTPHVGDDIVWTTWRHVEAKNKRLGDNSSLDDQQSQDLQVAQAASTATTVNSFMQMSTGIENGYLGTMFGAPVWQTGLKN